MPRLGLAIAGGALSTIALLASTLVPGGMFLFAFVPLPLFLVGLGLDPRIYWAGGLTALVIWVIAGNLTAALGLFVLVVGPVGLMVRQALRARTASDGSLVWYPSGLLLAWLSGCAILWLLLAVLTFSPPAEASGMEDSIRQQFLETLTTVLPGAPLEHLESLAAAAAPFALGIGAGTWMLLLAINGILAQSILSRAGRAIRPSPDIALLKLPSWLSAALVAAIVVGTVSPSDVGYIARNIAVVLSVAFFFAGLGVVHAFCRRYTTKAMVLAAFYVVLAFYIWAAPAVAALGLIDQWAKFRTRFKAPGSGQEEE